MKSRQRRDLRLGILAPVRGEADYLLEWIAYHRALGVDEFFLADNGGDDGTSDLLIHLDAVGIVTRLDWTKRTVIQLPLFNTVIPALAGIVDIVAVIDCDEFLRPLNGRSSITVAVAEMFAPPDVNAVALNWAIYGSSGLRSSDGRPVIERLSHRATAAFQANHHVKTLLRPETYIGEAPNPHYLAPKHGRYLNSGGELPVWKDGILGITETVTWNALRIDHYIIKSLSEFRAKKQFRGRPDSPNWIYPDDYFVGMDRNEVFDPVDPEFLRGTLAEMAMFERTLARGRGLTAFRAPRLWKRFRLRQAHGNLR